MHLEQPWPGLFTQPTQTQQRAFFTGEMHILKKLGFQVEVMLWYSLAVNYIQILDLINHNDVPQRVWNYCNDLYYPQEQG
jgi:cyclin L